MNNVEWSPQLGGPPEDAKVVPVEIATAIQFSPGAGTPKGTPTVRILFRTAGGWSVAETSVVALERICQAARQYSALPEESAVAQPLPD